MWRFKTWLSTCLLAGAALAQPASQKISSFEGMQRSTQALQQDDAQNPAMLWVQGGRGLWTQSAPIGKTCASCHGAISLMRGAAAKFPTVSAQGKLQNLSQQINACRTQHQGSSALDPEHDNMLSLEAAIAFESRKLPIQPSEHATAKAAQNRGEALFVQRMGQVDLSCKDCHNTHAGKRLGANLIVQGHPTAYPIFRLEWQTLGSLQRRLRGCMTAVRAQPFAYNSQELLDLEAYLALRAAGMPVESPGVRP